MTNKPRLVVCCLALVVVGSVSVASTFWTASPESRKGSPEVILRKTGASDSGHAWAVLELVADPTSTSSSLAILRLVFINQDNGMLAECRRVQPLADVTWPATLSDTDSNGRTVTATFINNGSVANPSIEVSVLED